MASWTGAEIKKLRSIYSSSKFSIQAIRDAIPRHTWRAIQRQAQIQKQYRPYKKEDGWLKDEVESLKVMYPDIDVTKDRLMKVLSRHSWRSIVKKAFVLKLRRGKRHHVAVTAHPLVKQCARLIDAAKLSPVAVFQEAGRGPDAASNVYCGRTDPRLTDFDKVLREIGMRLSIVPVGVEA